jgi:hypothetical protein
MSVEVQRHSFFDSTLAIGGLFYVPAALTDEWICSRADMDISKERKIYCPCRDTKSGSFTSQRCGYTDYATPLHIS